jgi:hypothetical protein
MALEVLEGIEEIGGFKVIRKVPDGMSWDEFDEYRKEVPIFITEHQNMISFKIQKGPIKEVGVLGCQVDTMIEAARLIISELNEKFPCIENFHAIIGLQNALFWLDERKKSRERRQVEGTSNK